MIGIPDRRAAPRDGAAAAPGRRVVRALVRETGRTAALLLLVTIAMFGLLNWAPGDPTAMYVNVQSLSPEELAAARHELGLDRSLPVRYAAWVGRMLQGDLGTSLRTGRPVLRELWQTGRRTLLLTGSAILLTLLAASLAAYVAATRRHPMASALLVAGGYVISALPVFWLGYLAIYIFTSRLGVLPLMGSEDSEGNWLFLLVPIVVLGLGNGTLSEITRHLRAHLEGVLQEDYIRTARAKGAPMWRHLYKDGFLLPLSSVLATKLPYVLGGAIVVEQVFNWSGMGRLVWQAAADRDYPILMGVTLASALIVRAGHAAKEAVQVAANPQLAE